MDPHRYQTLSFRPLKADDIPLIYSWLQQSHVREFYHKKPVKRKETQAHYLRLIDAATHTKCYLVLAAHQPFGYIQTYRVADYRDYYAMTGETEGISLDLFVGEPEYLGTGWGRAMLLKFLNEVAFPLFPGESVCWIYHEAANLRALRASIAVGFRYIRDFAEHGEPRQLLGIDREEVARRAAGFRGPQS